MIDYIALAADLYDEDIVDYDDILALDAQEV